MHRVRGYTYEEAETQLAQERERLADLETRGAGALSVYDKEIAHGGNVQQALETALYLTRNHIYYFEKILAELSEQGRQLGLL